MILRRKTAISLAAAMLALTLGGCATVGPDYDVPENAAARQADAAAPFAAAQGDAFSSAPLAPHWWRLYQDNALNESVETALRANADLRVAAANLARVRAALGEAEAAAGLGAGISANAGYGRASGASRGLSTSLKDAGSYDAGISVSYQIDLFGKIARGLEAARDDVQAAQGAIDLARVTVAADTARAYADLCSARRLTDVAQQSVTLQEEFLRLTALRVQGGRGTALDVSRARGQLEQLRAALPPLKGQEQSAGYRLAVLTGRVPGSPAVASIGCTAAPLLRDTIPVGDGAALLRRRPDIRQAERTLAGATARIGVATADLYPSISLGLTAGSSGALSNAGAANTFRWSLGPLISWTLPVNGVARARIAQARAGSEAALARFDATVLGALREVETALAVYAHDLDQRASLQQARDQSALAAEQARTLYRYGRTDFLTALDAERTRATAESTLANAEAKLTTDQIALFLALGGGWGQDGANETAAR